MSYWTPYDASIPVAVDIFKAFAHILHIAEKQPNATILPSSCLYPDMKSLAFQVEIASITASQLVYKLSGTVPHLFSDGGDITTFEQMHARIDETLNVLARADRELINSRIDEPIEMGYGPDGHRAPFPSAAYVFSYGLPNLFFHLSTAYGILRKEGVPLGKTDYLEQFGQRFHPE